MRTPKMRQLEAFRAVMLSGGLSAGARLLGISQPGASRLIRDLEDSLELSLFDRGNGRLTPTEDARQLFADVQRHFGALRDVMEAARGLHAFRAGLLRIAAGPTLVLNFLPGALGPLLARRPDLSVRLWMASSTEVVGMVSRGEVELGLASAAGGEVAGVVLEALLPLDAVCAVPAGHPLAALPAVPVAALDGQPFVALGGESLFQLRVAHALDRAGAKPRVRLEAPNSATAGDYVALGIGLAILDPFAVARLDPARVAVRPLSPAIPYEFLLARAAHARHATVREVVAAVRAAVAAASPA